MRIELIIILITLFFIYNTYKDNKYTNMLKVGKKYYKMVFYGFIGLSLLIVIKNKPKDSIDLFKYGNKFLRFLPIDKNSVDMISPIFNNPSNPVNFYPSNNRNQIQESKMSNSGKNIHKRSVSETKKKFVASNQNWQCAHCNCKLPAWFEVDHKIRLEYGGDNHINNLEALCRDCHGKKTSLESMN